MRRGGDEVLAMGEGERKPQSLCDSSSIENREQMRDLSVTSA